MEGDRPERRPRLRFTTRRAGDVLTAGFEVFGRGWRELLAIAALVTIPLAIAQTFLVRWLLSRAVVLEQASSPAEVPASFWTAFGATVGAFVVGFAITMLAQAAATRAVAEILVGRDPRIGRSYGAALSRLGPVLGATLLISLGVLGGFVLLIVPGFFLIVRWLVAVQAIVIERLGPVEGMRRSWDLVRGEGWHAFAVFLVVALLNALATNLVARVFPPDVLLQGIAAAIVQTVLLPFTTAVYVVLYVNLRVSKQGLDAEILEEELDG